MRHRMLQLAATMCLTVACGPTPTVEAPRCLKLSEPEGSAGLVTGQPALVSLFFGVSTCEGTPVSGLGSEAFDIQEDGKSISVFESQRTIQPRGQRFRMSSLLLLDLSGSVLKGEQFPALKAAATAYAHAVLATGQEGQRVGVMTFDGREKPQVLVEFTASEAAVLAGLDSLQRAECTVNADCDGFADRRACAGWRCVDDSTNLNGAVVRGLDALEAQVAKEPDITWREGALVLFTDGSDQASRVTPEVALKRAKASKAHLFTVGLGGEADEASLRAFGKDGFWPAKQEAQLTAAFEDIAKKVTSLANRFYLLEYCSPKRSGTHTLKLTATLPDGAAVPLVGAFSGEFDATGFTSGCALVP